MPRALTVPQDDDWIHQLRGTWHRFAPQVDAGVGSGPKDNCIVFFAVDYLDGVLGKVDGVVGIGVVLGKVLAGVREAADNVAGGAQWPRKLGFVTPGVRRDIER